ncbi:MAG: hypothetical protein HZB26_11140 [Candidatus Hydrogenedentes bacterium]|nr:hypothetical protein [Candidatus Hydrogenedentota bacterium]
MAEEHARLLPPQEWAVARPALVRPEAWQTAMVRTELGPLQVDAALPGAQVEAGGRQLASP